MLTIYLGFQDFKRYKTEEPAAMRTNVIVLHFCIQCCHCHILFLKNFLTRDYCYYHNCDKRSARYQPILSYNLSQKHRDNRSKHSDGVYHHWVSIPFSFLFIILIPNIFQIYIRHIGKQSAYRSLVWTDKYRSIIFYCFPFYANAKYKNTFCRIVVFYLKSIFV